MSEEQVVLWSVPETRVSTREGLLSACDAFEVRSGEVIRISGESGAGKSLLLRALCVPHMLEEDALFLEHDTPQRLARGAKLTYVPQRTPALAWLPLAEQITQATHPQTSTWPQDTNLLSGGQQKRLGVWRALENDPKVLVLDEPCVGLDTDTLRRVAAQLCAFVADGGALVLVSHQPALIEALSERPLRTFRVRSREQRAAHEPSPRRALVIRRRLESLFTWPGLGGMSGRWFVRLIASHARVIFHPRFGLFFALVGFMLGLSMGVTLAGLGARFIEPTLVLERGALPAVRWLAPPLALMLSAATFASSALAWSGQQRLANTHDTLEGLSVDTTRVLGQLSGVCVMMGGVLAQWTLFACMIAGVVMAGHLFEVSIVWSNTMEKLLRETDLWARWGLYPLVLAISASWHTHASIREARQISHRTLSLVLTTTLLVVFFECANTMSFM